MPVFLFSQVWSSASGQVVCMPLLEAIFTTLQLSQSQPSALQPSQSQPTALQPSQPQAELANSLHQSQTSTLQPDQSASGLVDSALAALCG